MGFTTRFANDADLDKIVAIENASMSCPWSMSSFKEAISSDHSFVMVAEEAGGLLGYSVFYLTPPESELPDIVVADAHRNKGVGRFLMSQSIEELKARKIDTVFLEVRVSNTAAIKLYESFGFEQIGVRKYFYSNPVEDAICMRLDVDNNDR